MNGLLLINLGTPDDPSVPAVRRYLAEFLSDPYVIDINPVARWLLLHGIILRTRPAKSAHAYQKIWTDRGSPLMFHSVDLAKDVAGRLESTFVVELAMRYGKPSIASALEKLKARGVTRLVVLPLYPQYSYAATISSIEKTKRELARLGWQVPVTVVKDFFDDEGFLKAFESRIRTSTERFRPDYTLFSFHGVPERHVKKTDPSGRHCLAANSCCDRMTKENRWCYRAQSFSTARDLAKRLELKPGTWDVSFQSRLGRTPWIKPYTDFVLPELARRGVKRLLVVSPAFVADCLETLEELEIRAREDFKAAGGEDLALVPSLNSEPLWSEAVCGLAQKALG